MAGTDSLVDRGGAVPRLALGVATASWAVLLPAALAVLLATGDASAAPATSPTAARKAAAAGKRGVGLAEAGNCVDALPLLEEAEARAHTPEIAVALAGCLVNVGDLRRAADLYDAVARERPKRTWTPRDHRAQRVAGQRDDEVEARVPKILFEIEGDEAADLQVAVNGRPVADLGVPLRIESDVTIRVEAFAEGYAPFQRELVLREGEKQTVRIALQRQAPPAGAPVAPEREGGDGAPVDWIGARFRGVLMPQLLMNLVADGGTTIFVPGGGLTYTRRTSGPDIVIGVQYATYQMGSTAFKPHGAPDTEWEILESDLHATIASADLMWRIPLDDAQKVELRLGAGIGVGIAFAGEIRRWQAYPPDGAEGDPDLWEKCAGPNDPAGTFRFCNQLDKDIDRYGRAEPYWHEDGLRPLFFPWLSVPQVGLTFHTTEATALDLELGLTLNGIMTGVGMRFGL